MFFPEMAAKTGLTVVKRMTYRDTPGEEWSNQYWFKGAPPSTQAEWETLAVAVAGNESGVYTARCSAVGVLGYDDNADGAHSVFIWNDTNGFAPITGQLPSVGTAFAGDQASMLEWKTTTKSSRGKWIYLRKYFHAGEVSSTDLDRISTGLVTALTTFGTFVENYHGGLTGRVNDYTLESQLVSPWVTTRTLKRRGKRPLVP